MTKESQVKIVFWGTPDFAVKPLEVLIENFNVLAVITNPDEPVGRKAILTPPPIKVLARKYKIPVFQPNKLAIENCKLEIPSADIYVVAAYGKIISKEILEIPKYGALNIHPSLLPKWRGASPIQYAILNGDEETGVTIMLMDEKMDHGPIFAWRELEIRNPKSEIRKYTTPELSEILSKMGAELIIETVPKWINGEIKPVTQDEDKATYSKILKKEDGRIDWSKSAEEVERQVRAFTPWPGSFTYWKRSEKEVRLELLEADIVKSADFPDNIALRGILIKDKRLFIKTGEGYLEILRIQPEGKKEMTAKEFINGYKDIDGATLM